MTPSARARIEESRSEKEALTIARVYIHACASRAKAGGCGYIMAGSREEANFVCDASPLSINDLQKIFEALYEARDKWRNLGGVFGVSEATLRCIAKEEDDEDSKLRRVISTWLETHGGTSHCSWRAAAQALRNITVGRHDVAHEVCANHSTSGQASSGRSVVTTPREDAELTTRDILAVTSYLIALDKPETMTLGQLLGLSHRTVTDTYEGSTKSMYLDSVITAWLNKQDDVIREGGPYWRTLVAALEHTLLGHNGIAAKIREDKNL